MKILLALFSIWLLGAGVAPKIKESKNSAATIKPSGDSFRYILFNTEEDACVTLERVNLRGKQPKVLSTERVCKLLYEKSAYSLDKGRLQDFSVEKIEWKGVELELKAIYVSTEPGAPALKMQCRLDAEAKFRYFDCLPQGATSPPSKCVAEGETENWAAKYCGYLVGSDDMITIQDSKCFRREMKDSSQGCERSLELKSKICAYLIKTYKNYPSQDACIADKYLTALSDGE